MTQNGFPRTVWSTTRPNSRFGMLHKPETLKALIKLLKISHTNLNYTLSLTLWYSLAISLTSLYETWFKFKLGNSIIEWVLALKSCFSFWFISRNVWIHSLNCSSLQISEWVPSVFRPSLHDNVSEPAFKQGDHINAFLDDLATCLTKLLVIVLKCGLFSL